MTDSEHAVLSAQLARALGWKHVEIAESQDECLVRIYPLSWSLFDYRDPTVYGPLIEWLGEQSPPMWMGKQNREWKPWTMSFHGRLPFQYADTLPEAVARAVISASRPTPSPG
jgi:hypothetical protein